MSDTQTPLAGGDAIPMPESFEDFERWRETGELPASQTESETDSSEAADESEPETDPDSETGDDEQESDEEDQPKKSKGGFQRRIDKLTRAVHERDARLQELERQLAGNPAAQPTEQPVKQEAAGKPKLESFNSYDEYVEKLAEWQVEQRLERERQAADQVRQQRAAEQQREQWKSRVAEARKSLQDWDEVMEAGSDLPITPAIQQAIVESEVGPQLAYHLAQNPDTVARIAQLSPLAAARELGRIEAGLSKSTPPEPKKVSKAPAPIRPVKTGGKGSIDMNDPSLDFSAWEKARNAQLRS